MTTIQNTNDLLGFLTSQANQTKDWFGYRQQNLTGIDLAYKIATHHADKMSPDEVVEYVITLNQSIFNKIIKGTR
jgi:hypothetical protein